MTEEEARDWLQVECNVPRETLDRLSALANLLRDASESQNLVARSTLDHIWSRHIVDSAQLLRFAPPTAEHWLDLGTGAGFPGLIVATLHPSHVTCVESRRLRVDFLKHAAATLGISSKVRLICAPLERIATATFDVISARAFAPLDRLFTLAERFASPETRWVLPKGRNARTELDAARTSWQGEFKLEPSLTDRDAQIIVARRVRRRGEGKA